ncbi:MAG: hypothetical protein WCG25_07615 [bacterium]
MIGFRIDQIGSLSFLISVISNVGTCISSNTSCFSILLLKSSAQKVYLSCVSQVKNNHVIFINHVLFIQVMTFFISPSFSIHILDTATLSSRVAFKM